MRACIVVLSACAESCILSVPSVIFKFVPKNRQTPSCEQNVVKENKSTRDGLQIHGLQSWGPAIDLTTPTAAVDKRNSGTSRISVCAQLSKGLVISRGTYTNKHQFYRMRQVNELCTFLRSIRDFCRTRFRRGASCSGICTRPVFRDEQALKEAL
jgi:hypothetical protein